MKAASRMEASTSLIRMVIVQRVLLDPITYNVGKASQLLYLLLFMRRLWSLMFLRRGDPFFNRAIVWRLVIANRPW
jgi:hypothetical protein